MLLWYYRQPFHPKEFTEWVEAARKGLKLWYLDGAEFISQSLVKVTLSVHSIVFQGMEIECHVSQKSLEVPVEFYGISKGEGFLTSSPLSPVPYWEYECYRGEIKGKRVNFFVPAPKQVRILLVSPNFGNPHIKRRKLLFSHFLLREEIEYAIRRSAGGPQTYHRETPKISGEMIIEVSPEMKDIGEAYRAQASSWFPDAKILLKEVTWVLERETPRRATTSRRCHVMKDA